MLNKLFPTKESKIYAAIVAGAVVLFAIIALITAVASDARRLVYTENPDGTYLIEDIKSIYRGGIFKKDELVIPSTHRGETVKSIKKIESNHIVSIVIEEGVETIENGAFAGMGILESITIPSSVTRIGSNAFSNCPNLKEVVLPDGIKSIENGTFNNCASLLSIDIPTSVEYIGDSAFANCTGLTEITIGSNVKSLGNFVFSGCKNLSVINCDLKNTEIGYQPFTGTKLAEENVKQNNGFLIIDKVLYQMDLDVYKELNNVTKLDKLVIPSNIEVINNGAFYEVASIKQIVIGDNVKVIGSAAFASSGDPNVDPQSLTTVFINSSNLVIESKVFNNCNKLKAIVYASESLRETITIDEDNTTLSKAKEVFVEGDEYYTYVNLTKENAEDDKTKLSYDLTEFKAYRINEGVKEYFNEKKYTFEEAK